MVCVGLLGLTSQGSVSGKNPSRGAMNTELRISKVTRITKLSTGKRTGPKTFLIEFFTHHKEAGLEAVPFQISRFRK